MLNNTLQNYKLLCRTQKVRWPGFFKQTEMLNNNIIWPEKSFGKSAASWISSHHHRNYITWTLISVRFGISINVKCTSKKSKNVGFFSYGRGLEVWKKRNFGSMFSKNSLRLSLSTAWLRFSDPWIQRTQNASLYLIK